jgi:hypothetical protein
MTMARRFSPNHVRRPFDFGPIVRADAFADEKRESDTAVLFVVDEESDNFVRDLHENRWRLRLKFIPRVVHHSMRPDTVYTPGAPSFAEDTKSPQPPIVEDRKKYSPPSGATDRPHGEFKHKPILLHIENSKKGKKGKKHTNVKKAKKGKKHMNVKKHMKGKKAKKQMNGKKGKKQRSVIH